MKLAEFVARNGRQFEEVTRQRNPGETPFKYVLKPVCAWFTKTPCYLMENACLLCQVPLGRVFSSLQVV